MRDNESSEDSKKGDFFEGYEELIHDEEFKKHKNEKLEIKSQPGSLNVIFMYNGYEWDAYEVLDIPAGSSVDVIKKAYNKAISKVDKKSRVFFNTAYRALLEGRRMSSKKRN